MAARRNRVIGSYDEASPTGRAQRRLKPKTYKSSEATASKRDEVLPAYRALGKFKDESKKRNVTQRR